MLPKKFVIGNVPYEIKKFESETEKDGTQFWGVVNYDKQNIKIAKHLEHDSMVKTLVHEATHAMLHEGGMEKFNKEDFVDRLSTALYDFLVNNDLSFLQQGKDFDSLSSAAKIAAIATEKSASEIVEAAKLIQETAISAADIGEGLDKIADVESNRSRKLPIDNDRSLSVPIKDLKPEEPEHYKTGIKIKYDIECYKTRYECVECGNKGTHYVPKETNNINCHECNHEMQKIPSTTEGFPHRDGWGNFFIAGGVEPYEEG